MPIQESTEKNRMYQTIFLHLSDGRTILAVVPEFCKEGDKLYLLPQFEVTKPKELDKNCRWSSISEIDEMICEEDKE